MKQKTIILALFGAIATPLAAYAEIPVMDEIVVTATRFSVAPENSSVNVTVVTAADIEKSAAKTLPDLLAQHAGIQMRSNDGTPDKAIDLRGFGVTGNQNTLVLLDGQPLNDIELTSIRWSAIPLGSIERIEIVNGSGAVLYGGGATGGTINIITKRPSREMRGNASVGMGSYGTREWQLALSGMADRVGMRVTASGLNSFNYRTNNAILQNNLEADLRTEAGKGDVFLKFGADNQNLRYPGVRTVDSTIGLNQLSTDPRGTSTPQDYGTRNGEHVSLGATQQLEFGELAGEISYRNKNQKAYFAAYGGSYLDTGLNVLSFTPRVKIPYQMAGAGNELIVGLDMADWSYDSRRATSPASITTPAAQILATQNNRALYLQNVAQLGSDTKITLGARSQRVEYNARDAVNPAAYATGAQGRTANAYEMGLRHTLSQDLAMFGRVGRSFRVATVDEIFDQYGGPLFDSKISMLEPQTSQDSEAGIDYKTASNRMRATLFQMNLNNEIFYNALTFSNMNLSPTRRYGLELEGMHRYSEAVEVGASYSYTVAKFREGTYGGINVAGNAIPLVPRQRFTLSPSLKMSDKNTLSASLLYVGRQNFDNDLTSTFGRKMPSYTVVDVKFNHREGAWLLSAAVNNLLNTQYITYGVASTATAGRYNAYPMQQRNLSFVATYQF
jgi:iron complex outermembrane receptor protein